jgi:RNA-directed DNA polymerase
VGSFDNVQHYLLLEKVARRVQDAAVMGLLKMILKATGEKGVPQGGVISPVLSNLYLTEVDRMLEKAIATTRYGKYTYVQYARFADDLVILIDSHRRHDWLVRAVERRLREEVAKLRVEINEDKSRMVDLAKGGSFTFLGFEYRRILSRNGVWRPYYAPKLKKRTALFAKLREVFRRKRQPASGEGDRRDQSDPTRVGELLSSGAFESMFLHGQALGGKEGPAASDAIQATFGYGLETVE